MRDIQRRTALHSQLHGDLGDVIFVIGIAFVVKLGHILLGENGRVWVRTDAGHVVTIAHEAIQGSQAVADDHFFRQWAARRWRHELRLRGAGGWLDQEIGSGFGGCDDGTAESGGLDVLWRNWLRLWRYDKERDDRMEEFKQLTLIN